MKMDHGRAALDDKAAQEEVDELIQALESENPTENPADDPLRRGAMEIGVYNESNCTRAAVGRGFLLQRIVGKLWTWTMVLTKER